MAVKEAAVELPTEQQLLAKGLSWGGGWRGSPPCALAPRHSRAPVCPPGKEHEMQRAGACARVCVSVSEGVTEAPTCPARPCCGRRQAEGRGGGCGRRREGARSRGWAPHLPAPPPLDAEAAAATRPRPPCAQAGPAGGVLGGGSPLHTQTNHILLLSGPPNPLNPNGRHQLPVAAATTITTPLLSQQGKQ